MERKKWKFLIHTLLMSMKGFKENLKPELAMAQMSWSSSRTASSGFPLLIRRIASVHLLLLLCHLLQHLSHRSSYFFFFSHLFTSIRDHRGGNSSEWSKSLFKVNRELSVHIGMMGSSFISAIFYINALVEFITF